MTKSLTVAQHRSQLDALQAETETNIVAMKETYDELDPEEAGSDVGAGEDEGGSEGDLTRFERDRLRARIAEENQFLEVIAAARERANTKGWKNCSKCGKPIGDARLEVMPATDLCVVCKADRGNW